MKLHKGQLELTFTVLKDTNLSLQDSRIRDAFLKPLGEAVDTFYKERTAIYEKFCDKKEDGTPDIDDGKYHFKKEVTEEADKELKTLITEEVEIEEKWGVTKTKLKELMEKTNYSPKVGEVEVIDSILVTL